MSTEPIPCFIYSKDLMFSSQAQSAATTAGFDAKTVLGIQQIDHSAAHFVVLDLTIPNLDIAADVGALKQGNATVIAVGPHVHEAKLELAKASGCDSVLTKGQASRELGAILQQLASSNEN